MPSPNTYAAWAALLEKFVDGDDTTLEELSNASFVVDAGTATRFYACVEKAYKKRKQFWLEKFQQSLRLQNFKTEDDFGMALRNGKQHLSPLSKLVALPGLPADLQKTLKKDLEDFVAEIKKSLKDNVSKISNGREKMLVLLNSFGLQDIPAENNAGKKNDQPAVNNVIPSGRKIIF